MGSASGEDILARPAATGGTVDPAWLYEGGGEMRARLRAFDWANSPLGQPGQWPPDLVNALGQLLSSRAQIVLFCGPELNCFYNDAYTPVLGAKHPAALGRPAREVFAELWDVLSPLIEGVLRTGEAFWATDHPFTVIRHGYPEETYFDVSYDPVRGASGTVDGVLGIVSDTTGRVVGERRLRLLGQLGSRLADVTDAAALAREVARVLADEPADVPFARVYLQPDNGRAGAGPLALAAWSGPAPADAVPAVVAEVAATGAPARAPAADLLPAAAPGGVLEAVVVPISGGTSTVGALALGVNPRRPLDGEYHDFLDLVGAQVSRAIARQRAYEAERARAAELAALDRAKTQFFANISHEFRTPLTLILGPLGDILAGDPPAALVEPLTAMHRNGRRLHKLVNAVLDFSRLESGRLVAAYAPTDLAACTAHLASAFRSAAERAGLSFAVQCPPLPRPVHVDAEMWEKIVLNLISNAVKHTFTGGITVRMRDGGAAAVLEVIDTGIGIPADEQPYLFERFHRVVGARSRSHEGTGIGLAVVEELAALHGATVSVRSRPGEGSTFAVTVPYGTDHLPTDRVHDARPPAGAGDGARPYVEEADWWLRSDTPPAAAPPAVGKRGGRILVVDDNADLRAYLVRLLSAHWQVVTAADGTAALAAAAGGDFDLVLTDVMMPRLDGLELVAALRADPLTRHLPIVVLTARAGEEASVRGLTAGADDYLVKPFTAQELVARVRANLELGKLRGGVIRRLRALADSAVALGTARTTAEVIRVAAEHVCRLTGVRHAAVSAGDLRHDADGARPADGRPATRVPLIGVAGVRRGEIEVWWDADVADAADAHALDELARIVALRLENAQLYEAEHRIATTLQHSLLPQSLPPVPGTVLACRYVPGSGEADVGGDWYDAVALPDGQLALVIGDVVGKGVRAAAMMGQVRNALRAYLLEGFPPAEALERLNRLVGSLGRAHFATVVCVLFDPGTGRLRYASAGHPAPVVINPSGAVGFLHAEALGPPVGALPGATFTAEEVTVEAGTRMLFYTDGLVEDRRRGIDAGLGELLADAARPSRHVEDLLDDMLARAQQRERRDDIAVLALEVTRPNRFAARLPADPNQLSALRRRLERFLTGHGVSEDDAFDMVVAVSEAVANAIEHPVDPAEAGVEVTAEIADGTLTVTVSDTGRWRQPAASTQRGRGLALIGALADLDVQQGPDGTTLTITRRLTARH